MSSRVRRASGTLARAVEEGLTQHEVVAHNQKSVVLSDGSEALEFVSCSYLGLESHPALVEASKSAIDEFGVHLSTSRNRMRPYYLRKLQDLLGQVYGCTTVAFTSVSAVHLGLIPVLAAGALPSLPLRPAGPSFLVEKTAHSSMQVLRGVFEQFGPTNRFDLAVEGSLEKGLRAAQRSGRTPIVLVDGVGSMGGLVPVAEIYEQTSSSGGILYIDDAHGTSIVGETGGGYALSALGNRVPPGVVIAGSLSKAFGGCGGFATVSSPADAAALETYANSLVFGHSIMLPLLAANVASARLHVNGDVVALQERLWRNVETFDALTGHHLVNAGLRSPVRGALFDEEGAFAAARRLRNRGILILPAFFPTVAQGRGLIRFGISALHQDEHLSRAAQALQEAE